MDSGLVLSILGNQLSIVAGWPFFICGALLIGLIVVIIIVAFIWRSWAEKKLNELCEKEGWIYHGTNVPGAASMIKGTPLSKGHTQRMYWGVQRNFQGEQLTTFQWQYTVGGGKYKQVVYYKVAMMPVHFEKCGYIFLRKEGIMDKIPNVFGFNDLDFEHQGFSKKYYIRAKPEKFGYDFFNPRMIEVFLRNRGWNLVVKNNTMMLYKKGSMGGIGMIFKLRSGKNPFSGWMDGTGNMFVKMKKHVPRFMQRKKTKVPDEHKVVGTKVVAHSVMGGKKMLTIECPGCTEDFEVAQGTNHLICPNCGLEGEM